MTLDIRRSGRTVIVHSDYCGPVDLTFEGEAGGLWYVNEDLDFVGDRAGKFGFHIDKRTEEAWIIHRFDKFESGPYEGWFRYQLEGFGVLSELSEGSIPYGTIAVEGETFTIYEMTYERTSKRNGKGVTGVTYEDTWSGSLCFEIIITPPP